MKFIAALSFLSALAALAAATGNLLICDSTSCGSGSCFTEVDQPNGGNGNCVPLEGILSVESTNVDPGCSYTIYADPDCNTNPLAAGLDGCFSSGDGIIAYSYDC